MATDFVPLLKDHPDANAPASATAAGFRPLVQAPQSRPNPEPAPSPEPGPPPTAPTGPTLTVQRAGERITQIQIRCTCGQVIELDCDY